MSDLMTKIDQRGQQSVDERQTVLRTDAYSPLPRLRGKSRLVTLLPQRAGFTDQFSDHFMCRARDPPIADKHRTCRIPHHLTMINHSGSARIRSRGSISQVA
jgi:hypothetical protein